MAFAMFPLPAPTPFVNPQAKTLTHNISICNQLKRLAFFIFVLKTSRKGGTSRNEKTPIAHQTQAACLRIGDCLRPVSLWINSFLPPILCRKGVLNNGTENNFGYCPCHLHCGRGRLAVRAQQKEITGHDEGRRRDSVTPFT